jgi:hypothetical protein
MSDQFGSYRINPAFDRHPEEAAIIGRILAGFGEIEFLVVRCAGHAVAMEDQMWRAFYRLRMTSARLELADAFMKPAYSLIGLRIEYDITYDMVIRCLAIRNQYAHCNWADHSAFLEAGLFFADIQDAAQSEEPIELSLAFRHIDVPLLEKQYRHFQTTMEWLMYLETEFANLKGRLSQHWPKPPGVSEFLCVRLVQSHPPLGERL